MVKDNNPNQSVLVKNKGNGLLMFVALAAFVVAMVSLAQQRRLRVTNETLRAQLQDQIALANAMQNRRGAMRNDEEEDLPDRSQMTELMRLRGEVTQLRAASAAAREALKDALENRMPGQRQVRIFTENETPDVLTEANEQPVETTDPLAPFRRNPELMKRYFPHLFNEQPEPQEQEVITTEVPAQILSRYGLQSTTPASETTEPSLPPEPAPAPTP